MKGATGVPDGAILIVIKGQTTWKLERVCGGRRVWETPLGFFADPPELKLFSTPEEALAYWEKLES